MQAKLNADLGKEHYTIAGRSHSPKLNPVPHLLISLHLVVCVTVVAAVNTSCTRDITG